MSKFNANGWNAVPCNGPLQNYDTFVRNATPAERASFFMNPRNNTDTTSLYPWSRDIVATSGWATSAKELLVLVFICISPPSMVFLLLMMLSVRIATQMVEPHVLIAENLTQNARIAKNLF